MYFSNEETRSYAMDSDARDPEYRRYTCHNAIHVVIDTCDKYSNMEVSNPSSSL